MKSSTLTGPRTTPLKLALTLALAVAGSALFAAPAARLFRDDFTGGIPGWTAVLPSAGAYVDGPMLWEYDVVSGSFSEQSNLYTDTSTYSGSRIATMLINNTLCPTNFTYTARLTAGDDDAFGLIWGYEGEMTFYRVYFARQNRALNGWPYMGWGVDRMNNGMITDLFGPDNSTFVNKANQPFDVTIAVNNGLLTLTVVDDPLVTSNYYALVTAAPLPTVPANGRVGMFSWGQSGNNPRAFRVQTPSLSPVALSGDPAHTVLTNWSFVVTPRSDGVNTISSGGTEPIWAQALGPNGDRGAMIQNSDSYNSDDNVAGGTTNFICPTAVAGDSTWSNYVVSARFTSADDDGFGLVLRYQNENNFYRIAFRRQSGGKGIRQGLTVQKNVNLVFDQVYSNSVAGFVPPMNVPFEVYAAIRGSQLQIVAINNPDGMRLTSQTGGGTAVPTVTASGLIDFDSSVLVPDRLDTGKIGVISWAQNNATYASDDGTAVDWIQADQVNGEALIVSSAYGSPNPAVGVNDMPLSQVVTASVESVVSTVPGIRQVCTGWTGVGSVPASGSTNQVVFTMANLSAISWQWVVQYLLTTNATVGGTVTATAGPWINATSNVTVRAVANTGYVFTGWSGDCITMSTNLTLTMIRPTTLTANFSADSDGDGLPDNWEMKYFGNLAQDGTGDPDGDIANNLLEYQRGTNPTYPENLFASDGLSSQWVNTQRDPGLPGEVGVVDFGSGYRGAYGNGNEYRYSTDLTFIPTNNAATNASFQSPRFVVRSNLWTESWGSNFSASCEFTVGDNDAVCFYFRYVNESNWFRATLCGEDAVGATTRPVLGLSVQRRLNGFYTNVFPISSSGSAASAWADPTDGDTTITRPANTPAGFKRLRLTVNATNENFEVRVIGWNYLSSPAGFDPNWEYVEGYTDASLSKGRIGFGFWGQGVLGGDNSIHGIPIPDGAFIDNISVLSPAGGAVVFSETWETAAMTNEFPAGWLNPFLGDTSLQGNWKVNADGSISEMSNQGLATTGTATMAKANADGPILLAPGVTGTNYYLEVGFHQFDNDGIGIVYEFADTNNYSRAIFRQEATLDGAIPPGLSVSRKVGGVWTDVTAGDPSFLYTPGRPFKVEFANNNGDYTLLTRDPETGLVTGRWHWTGTPATTVSRFGVTTWGSQSAHVTSLRAYSLPHLDTTPFKITAIRVSGGNVVLDISKAEGAKYNVLRASSVGGPYDPVAQNQTAAQYSEPMPGEGGFYRLQLVP